MFSIYLRFSFTILFLTVIVFNNTVNAQKTSLKPYNIKSGIIEYKYSGFRSGKSTLYFDDYGLKSAMKNEIKSDYKNDNSWVISLREDQYIFDPAKPDDGIKMKNPLLEGFFEMQQKDYDEFVKEFYTRMGYKIAGKEKYLGKDCIVYRGKLGKVLIWDGIMLYMESDFGGVKSKQEATSVKVNVPVDAKYFQIPKNIKFKEAPDIDDIDKLLEQDEDSEK